MPAARNPDPHDEPDLYQTLGVSSVASSTEIRRAYRTLITKQHPDKGGDAAKFAVIQRAYDVLSETESRNRYDQTGVVEKSVEDELLDSFGGGAFRDRGAEDVASKKTLEEALTVTQQQHNESHSAGFEAWQRSRGTGMNKTIGVEDIIETYGVVKGSYDEITLPKIRAFRVDRMSDDAAGGNKSSDGKSSSGAKFSLSSEPIPSTLEWGQVLLHIRASPVNPADLAPGTGAEAGSSLVDGIARKGSFTLGDVNIANAPKPTNLPAAGADFVAVVLKTGAGVKTLAEGDWVMPRHPSLGAWRSLFCAKEKDLRKIAPELMQIENCAMLREFCVAYRLLEDAGDLLRPGDAVIVDGASGAIGGVVVQLCALLKMRAVAVVRPVDLIRDTNANAEAYGAMGETEKEKVLANAMNDSTLRTTVTSLFAKTHDRLKRYGAAEVLLDEGDLRTALERRRFFARPKLALDCIGGAAAARVAHALQDSGRLVVFGCMSGRAVTLPWTTLVARGLTAKGFSLRKWMDAASDAKIEKMFQVVAKLVNANKLAIDHCEYELSSEFQEAMEHSREGRREVKIVLRVDEVGDTYE